MTKELQCTGNGKRRGQTGFVVVVEGGFGRMITLNDGDAAIVVRKDGSEAEVVLPGGEDREEVSPAAIIVTMLCLVLEDEELGQVAMKNFDKRMEEMKNVVDTPDNTCEGGVWKKETD